MPIIQFVNIDLLLQHEDIETRRYYELKKKIMIDKAQKHPVIVTPLDDNKYLVLDGAHKVKVIKHLGYDKVICQIVDKNEFSIEGWTHNLNLTDYSNINLSKELANESKFPITVTSENKNSKYDIGDFLNDSLYLNRYKELVNEINMKESFKRGHSKELGTLNIKYPTLELEQIKALVSKGLVLPAGVTKVSIKSGRVLCVNVPLNVLKSNFEDTEFIKKLEGNLRFYNESIYLYEER